MDVVARLRLARLRVAGAMIAHEPPGDVPATGQAAMSTSSAMVACATSRHGVVRCAPRSSGPPAGDGWEAAASTSARVSAPFGRGATN
jgi:hypothetical protein